MRRLALLVVAACGNSSSTEDARIIDGPPDAPVLPPCASPVTGDTISVRRVGGDTLTVPTPMLVTAPAGDRRLFVVSQRGEIRIITDEVLAEAPFIDLSDDSGGPVAAGGELGLLGLAFHPQYHINRQYFVYYTKRQPDDPMFQFRDVVARCETMADDPDRSDRSSCVEILVIRDPLSNHNGGMIEFGLDGMLYIGTGDGGGGGDPNNSAQTLTDGQPLERSTALLGKLLRIDVDARDAGKEYGIPLDNPFLASGAPEVFGLGLRNPWRWSFDRATGDLYLGDVGQEEFEELHVVRAADLRGTNFGWDMYEGDTCFASPCDANGKTFPVDVRTQLGDGWQSIIGGQVYRGTCFPSIVGSYFYADHFTTNLLVRATLDVDGTITKEDLTVDMPLQLTSIHAAADGELYLTMLGGQILHLEAGP